MYKEIINSKEQTISIVLPKSYLNKELEITITPIKKKKSKYDKYFGITKTDNLDDSIKKLRNEWDRL